MKCTLVEAKHLGCYKDEDDGDKEESSDDDQSSSNSSIDVEESLKIIRKVEKLIQKLNVKGVPIQNSRLHLHQLKKRAKKERMLWMWKEGALCGSLPKQTRTQGKEEGKKS